MNIYVFGNPLVEGDDLALKVAESLKKEMKEINFIFLDGMEDIGEENPVILDVAKGIAEVKVIEDLDILKAGQVASLHDADLAFFLKLRKKIGEIKTVRIIAIPWGMDEEEAVCEVKKKIQLLHPLHP